MPSFVIVGFIRDFRLWLEMVKARYYKLVDLKGFKYLSINAINAAENPSCPLHMRELAAMKRQMKSERGAVHN